MESVASNMLVCRKEGLRSNDSVCIEDVALTRTAGKNEYKRL